MKYNQFTLGQIEAVFNKLGGEEGVQAFLRGEVTVTKVVEAVKEKNTSYLRLLTTEPLVLTPTNRKQTIAQAEDVFHGIVDWKFTDYGVNVTSELTDETKVEVHELVEVGRFAEIFGSLPTNLDNLCLTQPQIIQFVQSYHWWLGEQWTFFLFKVSGEFFVARVLVVPEGLDVFAYRIGDRVWSAQDGNCRFILPQLNS